MNAREKAIRYMSYRPRCRSEIEKYLKKCGYSEDQIADATEYLTEMKYLDHISYAESFIRYNLNRGRSIGRIKYELRMLGISQWDIEDAVFSYEEDAEESIEEKEILNAEKEASRILGDDFHKKVSDVLNGEYETREERYTAEKELARKVDRLARRLASLGYPPGFIAGFTERYRRNQ